MASLPVCSQEPWGQRSVHSEELAITEEDLELIQERETSIRQLEVGSSAGSQLSSFQLLGWHHALTPSDSRGKPWDLLACLQVFVASIINLHETDIQTCFWPAAVRRTTSPNIRVCSHVPLCAV